MRAAAFDTFGGPVTVRELADPVPGAGEVVVRLGAAGLCRSDWHGWQGHDADIVDMPHVPGHELAGWVEEVGPGVQLWKPGARVTVPFVAGCGHCPQCHSNNQQVCDHQAQPGFTHWGAFAELVLIRYADGNLVALPEELDFVTAASLGCRFTTAWRAVAAQGRAAPGEWVAVHGCGGVGLSAVMIARCLGARVAAVDIDPAALELARTLGAEVTIDGSGTDDVAGAIAAATDGGAHLSLDALGHPELCATSVRCLRKRGRHVQVGLLLGEQANTAVPMDRVVGWELELLGSHGMQAHLFPPLFEKILAGELEPARLVGRTVDLDEGAAMLMKMDRPQGGGITVIDRFGRP